MINVTQGIAGPIIVGLCIFGLGIAASIVLPPGPDILWRLHIGEAILAGQKLYRDIIEVNPPLWFWAALPAAFVAQITPLSSTLALAIFHNWGIVGASFLFIHLARKTLDGGSARWVTVAYIAGLCLMSMGDLGQREQSLLLASGLWVALISARAEKHPISFPIACLTGFFCAYGFALKHYFILIPVVLEAWLLWHQRRIWRPWRPENVVLLGCACLYAGLVFKLAPEFLTRVLNLVQLSYYGFGPWNAFTPQERLLKLIAQCSFIILPIIAFVCVKERRTMASALLLASLTCCVIVWLQQKGWRYHFIAANGLSIMVLSLMCCPDGESQRSGRLARVLPPLALAPLVWTAIVQPALASVKNEGQWIEPALKVLIAQQPKDNRIMILSTAPERTFYPLARAGRPYGSRHYSMWMLPALLTPRQNPHLEAMRQEELKRVRSEFVADLMCSSPDLIIGEVGFYRNPQRKLFDAMAFMTQDLQLKAWLDEFYQQGAQSGPFPVWRLKDKRPAPKLCGFYP
ncbi:hypothetical protein [Candidatus Phycosocius spiralis]|uniref:Glycosyltransferase RgtA/B/C/D-like domain-containing protein n=1 Tax=Candidatus Phycosocius spiralis TaxID=2815099 RepID=A0ABQ4PWJ4_9PROT|nr:hypothetical protein [Candidatus Phycosocius spiralis]GIU67360.1 hypothetical protein PsB1_1514 [Candidatus Phycosocius spiralis]